MKRSLEEHPFTVMTLFVNPMQVRLVKVLVTQFDLEKGRISPLKTRWTGRRCGQHHQS